MKLFAVDIETTGLDPKKHAILEIAIIQFDSQGSGAERWWHRYVIPEDMLWTEYCLKLHAFLLTDLLLGKVARVDTTNHGKNSLAVHAVNLLPDLRYWMRENGLYNEKDGKYPKLTACGKNFGRFDQLFIEDQMSTEIFKIRSLDPTLWFARHTDEVLPDLLECKKRAAEEGCKFAFSEVRHNAIDDALDIVFLIQHVMQKRDNFYEEYKRFKSEGLAS